jgi:hypothetical protein
VQIGAQEETRKMSQFTYFHGYYDDTGNWQYTKFCFVQCQHCDCQPPGMLFYSAAHDKRKNSYVVKSTPDVESVPDADVRASDEVNP